MHQWKVMLATALIFGSGVGTGRLLSKRGSDAVDAQAPAASQQKLSPQTPLQSSHSRPMLIRSQYYLDNHLKLTDAQKAKLRAIRKDSHDRIREFGAPFRAQIEMENERVRNEIRALLTPDQVRTFDGLPHFRNHRESGRPGTDRPPQPPTPPRTNNGPAQPTSPRPEGPSADTPRLSPALLA